MSAKGRLAERFRLAYRPGWAHRPGLPWTGIADLWWYAFEVGASVLQVLQALFTTVG